jgi:hypothetical protein
MENYLMIQNNVVTNVVLWDGGNEWTPPSDATMLLQEIIPAIVWDLNEDSTDWILEEQMGQGQIGFTWNGTILTTNEPKPPIPTPPPT